jgi:hypothetical protein
MKGHGTNFARKKEEAIAALLTQRNIEEAAKAVGIAGNTLLKMDEGAGVRRRLQRCTPGRFGGEPRRLSFGRPNRWKWLWISLYGARVDV